ncbi:MAG TPA: BON domain-containing protein [Steroidobacteraceae bacterium]|nr:BON domain-containing protein [Steroidobacteraceae bacterium]
MACTLTACASYEKCGFEGCPGDAQITADVRALFDRHPELGPSGPLTVQTLDGVVYLYGVVATDLVREEAESIALKAPGVKKVVNSLGVTNGGR